MSRLFYQVKFEIQLILGRKASRNKWHQRGLGHRFIKKNHSNQRRKRLGNLFSLSGLTGTPGGSDLVDLQSILSDIEQDAGVGSE